MAAERPGLVVTRLVARRSLRSGLVWGLVFGLAVASSVEQFTTAYDTDESRRQIAGTIGGNGALRALFGSGRALETVPGWTAWRSLGIVTILGSIWALLAATRWLRGEEDSVGSCSWQGRPPAGGSPPRPWPLSAWDWWRCGRRRRP